MRSRTHFWLVDINFIKNSMTYEARFWLVDIRKDKSFHIMNARFWLVGSKTFENSLVRLVDFISARLNSISILIFFHVKNNCLRNLLFLFTFIHFLSLFNFTFLKIRDILNLSFFFFYLLRCRHWKETKKLHVLNVAENSSEELTDHIKKKNHQLNVKLCAQQSQNTLQQKKNLIYFW